MKWLVQRETLRPGQLEVEEAGRDVQVWIPALKLQVITGLAGKTKSKYQQTFFFHLKIVDKLQHMSSMSKAERLILAFMTSR